MMAALVMAFCHCRCLGMSAEAVAASASSSSRSVVVWGESQVRLLDGGSDVRQDGRVVRLHHERGGATGRKKHDGARYETAKQDIAVKARADIRAQLNFERGKGVGHDQNSTQKKNWGCDSRE